MTDIGRTTDTLSTASAPRLSLAHRFDNLLDGIGDWLVRCLCRASRGYLCPPDMTSVMYPDEPSPAGSRPAVARPKECCNEKLPGK